MRRSRFRGRHVDPGSIVAILILAGCGPLPAPLAPTPVPAYSVLELERAIEGEASHFAFSEGARLTTPEGAALQGREEILSYLSGAAGGNSLRAFSFEPEHTFRCGEASGLVFGHYRAVRDRAGRPFDVAGPWQARWHRGEDQRWLIIEAVLGRPGDPVKDWLTSDCVDTSAEVASRARLTVGVHGGPFSLFTGDPHPELKDAGRHGYAGEDRTRRGFMAVAGYRLNSWLALDVLGSVDPHRRTTYRSILDGSKEWLLSGADVVAVMPAYQARNVTLEAGPALVRSWWRWATPSGPPGVQEAATRLGGVAGARVTIPLRSDMALEFMGQYRLMGTEVVPRTTPVRQVSRSGFFFGLGFAVRRTSR